MVIGNGEFTFEDGRKLIGTWKKDKKHGHVKEIYPSGAVVQCNWKKGKRDGYCYIFNVDGSVDRRKYVKNEMLEEIKSINVESVPKEFGNENYVFN